MYDIVQSISVRTRIMVMPLGLVVCFAVIS